MASALVQFSTFWWIHSTGRNNLHFLWLQGSLDNISLPRLYTRWHTKRRREWSSSKKIQSTQNHFHQSHLSISQRLCWVKFFRNRAWGKDSWFIRRVLSGASEWRKQNWLGRQGNKNETQLIPQNSPAVLTKKAIFCTSMLLDQIFRGREASEPHQWGDSYFGQGQFCFGIAI